MLSVIITHHQTPTLLKLCLKAMKENITDVDYELIVTDCKADSKNDDLVKKLFPKARIISFSKNVGYAKIVNAGINSAKGDYILILNADIIITRDAVSKMMEFMDQDENVGIIGPQLLSFKNTCQDSCFRFPTFGAILARRTFLSKTKWGKQKIGQFTVQNDQFTPQEVDWLQGSAMLVRKKSISQVGLWDERFFMYFEDTDWCRRFWQRNYKVVFLPTARMYHYYGRQSKKWGEFLDPLLNKYTRMHLISAFKYFRKWRHYDHLAKL